MHPPSPWQDMTLVDRSPAFRAHAHAWAQFSAFRKIEFAVQQWRQERSTNDQSSPQGTGIEPCRLPSAQRRAESSTCGDNGLWPRWPPPSCPTSDWTDDLIERHATSESILSPTDPDPRRLSLPQVCGKRHSSSIYEQRASVRRLMPLVPLSARAGELSTLQTLPHTTLDPTDTGSPADGGCLAAEHVI